MNFVRPLVLALVFVSCLQLHSSAGASACKRQTFIAWESQAMLGRARLVFVGTLVSLETQDSLAPASQVSSPAVDPPCSHAGEDELSTPHVVGWTRPRAVGIFRVHRQYKGSAPATVKVRVSESTTVGLEYLVYADQDSGELMVSESRCWRTLLPVDRQIDAYFAHLNSLESRGGQVSLRAHFESPPRPVPKTVFRFISDHDSFDIETDEAGLGSKSKIPAGRYRLLTEAPAGHQLLFQGRENCRQLDVQDLDEEHVDIYYQASSSLTVALHDSQGRTVGVPAQFEILDAQSGAKTDWWKVSAGSNHNRSEMSGRLLEGKVVVALVLEQFTHDGGVDAIVDRRRVFSGGAQRFEDAPKILIKPGENRFDFRLPLELQPVLTQVQFSGMRGRDYAKARLISAPSEGRQDMNVWLTQLLGQDRSFWSIPGQHWRVSAHRHRPYGTLGEVTVAPSKASTLHVELETTDLTKQGMERPR